MKGAKERCDSAVQATEQAVAETGLSLPQLRPDSGYAVASIANANGLVRYALDRAKDARERALRYAQRGWVAQTVHEVRIAEDAAKLAARCVETLRRMLP